MLSAWGKDRSAELGVSVRAQQAQGALLGLTNTHCPGAAEQRCFGVQDLHPGGNTQLLSPTLQNFARCPRKATVPHIHPMSILKADTQVFPWDRGLLVQVKILQRLEMTIPPHCHGSGDIPPSAALLLWQSGFL